MYDSSMEALYKFHALYMLANSALYRYLIDESIYSLIESLI